MTYSKEKMERNDINSHSVKPDREMYRICPSKLCKRELEDLYFTLLENNLELKKTINGQQDKIRVLSTQVQRMANTQERIVSKELKECCTGTRAIVDEQKNVITELKETNQRMAERNQQLNRRLSSAKQFLKTAPPQAASRLSRTNGSAIPKRHDGSCQGQEIEPVRKTSASNQWEDGTPKNYAKSQINVPVEKTLGTSTQAQIRVPLENKSQETEPVLTLSNSSQYEERTPKKSTQTQISVPLEKRSSRSEQPCVENKCRSLMEELKVKIVTLQEELFNVHDEYSSRIGRLEDEVLQVRKENIRVVAERSASEYELQNSVKRTNDILGLYRLYEAKCAELTTELLIEKRKVRELETQLKAANKSGDVNKAIDQHLASLNTPPPRSPHRRKYAENFSAQSSPTKYIASKSSSSASKISKAGRKEKMSKIDDCESCGCKHQLKKDPTRTSPTRQEPDALSCELCECPHPKYRQENQKEATCRCYYWVDDPSEDPYSEDQPGVRRLSPRAAATASPTTNKDGTKSNNEADDSGYQDTDELYSMEDILKVNKALRTKILELQSRLDHMKIGEVHEMSRAEPDKLSESRGSPKKTTDNSTVSTVPIISPILLGESTKTSEPPGAPAAGCSSQDTAMSAQIHSPPLLGESPQAKKLVEQTENNTFMKPLSFQSKSSEEILRQPGKTLNIDVLANPEEGDTNKEWSKSKRTSDDTRAKTKEDAYGTIRITDDLSTDGSFDNREQKTDFYKLKIVEKKKQETENISFKSPTIGFNPEKLKYLEAEGIKAKPEIRKDMPKLKEDSVSLTESVPSNPELGFGIPRLASKASQNKQKAESKLPPGSSQNPQQARDDNTETLPGKLRLPMTEALVANNQAAARQADETKKKEDCEYCAACSFDKECELKHENAISLTKNKLALGMQKKQAKDDQHNSLQIPGPMPTSDSDKRDKKRNILSYFKNGKPRKENKGCLTKEDLIVNQKICTPQTSAATDGPISMPDVPLLDKKELRLTDDYMFGNDSVEMAKKVLTNDKKDKSMKQKKGSFTKEDLIANQKTYAQQTCATIDGPINLPDVPLIDRRDDSPMRGKDSTNIVDNLKKGRKPEEKMPTYQPHSERMPIMSAPPNRIAQIERTADVAQNTDQMLPGKSRQAPTDIDSAGLNCGESTRQRDMTCQRNVSVYRRRSGTLTFRVVPTRQDPPTCRCIGQQDGYCTDKPRNKDIQVQDSEKTKLSKDQRHGLPASEPRTYTVASKQTGTSPDNTDLEMSYLSDLPMEKEKKSPLMSRSLSPGEDRTTTYTSTYSGYSPPTNYSLSEGEVPATTSKRRNPGISDKDKPHLNPALAPTEEAPPSQQMEAALHAISEEIRRCKTLLHAHQPARASCSTQAPPGGPPDGPPDRPPDRPPTIALRPAPATQGIGDKYTPTSIFTLHIGTVVLNDEAVRNFGDQNLVLKWKFYDQAVTMARMRAGRVVLFDFSTQYDVKVTEHFLDYLKHEEMPIAICEVDHEEQPFARCALPLRDALLHINTRVDMSLALVEDHRMKRVRANDVEEDMLDTGDEVGVIDLWCVLRADARMVPGIKLAIAQPGAVPMSMQERHSNVLSQVFDEYNELDLTMMKSEPASTQETTGKNQTYPNVEYTRTSNTWSNMPRTRQATETAAAQTATTATENTYDPSKYPPLRERNWTTPSHAEPKDDKMQESRRSKMIISEVNPKIKSPGDMKHALEGSNRLNDSRSRLPKSEDDLVSGAQSSRASLQTHSGERRSFIAKLRKASKCGGRPLRIADNDEATDMEIFKKYDNITKSIGSNKAEQSKKVTILPKLIDSQNDVPQRDVAKEPTNNANRQQHTPKLDITVLWLALNDECEAMIDPYVQRLYVAYSFLGRAGADLETPVSLPKPKHYVDKCYFNFKKTFELEDNDLVKLGHMARCRSGSTTVLDIANNKDCIVFSVVSEPAEDPLGIESCEDIGYAALYLGDLLAYSSGSLGYTEVIPVRAARGPADVCGVLAVRLDGLDVVRRTLLMTTPKITPRST